MENETKNADPSNNQADENFYPEAELRFFEKVWGKGFVSPGGPEEVAEILRDVDLENKRILDIGCGMGGIDILLVKDHGAAEVVGIDVEAPVLEKAKQYVSEEGLMDRIEFSLVEPGPLPFDEASFDIVFSKDALLHISDKKMLFADIFRTLKPNGMFVAGDWLRGEYEQASEQMALFGELTDNEFDMVTLREYGLKLRNAGFSEVALRDRNEWYLDVAKRELDTIRGLKDEIIAAVGLETYENAWESFWQVLVKTLISGEFRPAHIRARKTS
jgi:SAM-dependent methyltransferase